jgi:hypothetical protein
MLKVPLGVKKSFSVTLTCGQSERGGENKNNTNNLLNKNFSPFGFGICFL